MYSTTTLLCLSAWATVVVNMEDRVDVVRGDTAQITCMFTTEDGIGAIDITWFYVSFMMPDAHVHTYNYDVSVNVKFDLLALWPVDDMNADDQIETCCWEVFNNNPPPVSVFQQGPLWRSEHGAHQSGGAQGPGTAQIACMFTSDDGIGALKDNTGILSWVSWCTRTQIELWRFLYTCWGLICSSCKTSRWHLNGWSGSSKSTSKTPFHESYPWYEGRRSRTQHQCERHRGLMEWWCWPLKEVNFWRMKWNLSVTVFEC